MTRICYLIDEDTPHAIRDQLLRHNSQIEVLAVGDPVAPPFGTLDPDILRWIEQQGTILISRNRRTLPRHFKDHLEAGGHVPGIFLIRRRSSLGEVIGDLILIWENAAAEEYVDRLEYLPL